MRPDPLSSLIERFAEACQADDRVIAALLSGSHAAGGADEHSDVDLCLIATDAQRDELWNDREAFIRQLGAPLLLEDFEGTTTAHFILADGTEGELTFGAERNASEIHRGPYRALVDKTGVLDRTAFLGHVPGREEQVEVLRRQIQWFWHDLSHFVAAIGRDQLWWAAGQLVALRAYCVTLARLKADFATEVEGFDKLDLAVPASQLEPLADTFVPMERDPMLAAVRSILAYYAATAPGLAEAHGLRYPTELEGIMLGRFRTLEEG
jgi:lincosamide nucleotidyltransferase